MSHFTTGVIVENTGNSEAKVTAMLAPFDEGLRLDDYVVSTREQLIEHGRRSIEKYRTGFYDKYLADPVKYELECKNEAHLNYIKNEFPKSLEWSDEEVYQDEIKYTEPNDIDADGSVHSTYNPDSKWDWWSFGGRWNGLVSRSGKQIDDGEGGFNFSDEYRKLANNCCLVRELPADSLDGLFAIVTPDGKWHERGDMGWFGMVSDEKPDDEWLAIKQEIAKQYPDHLIVGCDLHI